MKRIALISDIHGNMYALEAFMKFVDCECSVSHVLNMGDFIQIGPNPREVYDVVMNDGRFVSIMGNSEYMFFEESLRSRYLKEADHQKWVEEQLGDERMQRLKQLPLRRTVQIEDKSFFMVHSRPDDTADNPVLYAGGTFAQFLADYNTEADYVLIGHTHLPLYAAHWAGKPIVNPGAIGCGKDGMARFAIAEIANSRISLSFHQVKYDKARMLASYRRQDVPCAEQFIAMFF